ncbi:MAG: hypothetical protein V4649_17950 [Bacteroidota bacterium]
MSPLDLQYFKACYVGDISQLEKLGLPEDIAFSFYFPKTSSYYYSTGCESMMYSPLCILSLAYELWQFFLREHDWKIDYDAAQECRNIERCFELLGVIPGEFVVDYYSMYYLKCSIPKDDEWFDEEEQRDMIKAGFKQSDISLFNAAQKCDLKLVEKLLQQGASPTIDLYNESAQGDLFNSLSDDISVNLWFYEEYKDMCYRNRELNDDYTRSMLCVLFSMASCARLLRLIKDYHK